ncbi:hypothetical protein CYMTET_21305 [Cymbomonas tetramitiformis]|uniref:Cation/H+ exchanger transmembrane domain-containing protein n=1 Tax=Cymbomonas tetramitiformis TaxID=36881 RepID=A0AAE0L3E2_9CHLO|nr:hypothetical protein CYMTET_21305 [Cymbomonas tetramitiformis]|eukprot:gene18607-22218_t
MLGLVELYSGLLVIGLGISQALPALLTDAPLETYGGLEWSLRFCSLVLLSFIMIHAGFHIHIDKSNLRQYAVDYLIAMCSAALPWIFAAVYLALIVPPHEHGPTGFERWKQTLLMGRFAAPTSAGVLFSMLDAAGLDQSWLYQKAKILAIFDDLDTILLMIPLKFLLVGPEWEVGVVLFLLCLFLFIGWKYMHVIKMPQDYRHVLLYGFLVSAGCEGLLLLGNYVLEPAYHVGEMHVEVLLPAFVIGVVAMERHEMEPAFLKAERKAGIVISAAFMTLVGLSMPPLFVDKPEWSIGGHRRLLSGDDDSDLDSKVSLSAGELVMHVFFMSILMVIGKLSCFFSYKQEASWRERLALGFGMCPRGEVGAGVIVVAAGIGVEGNMIAVSVLSLALNLMMTGVFIKLIKKLMMWDEQEKSKITPLTTLNIEAKSDQPLRISKEYTPETKSLDKMGDASIIVLAPAE